MKRHHILYLDRPADEWEMATPIGNGFCGAMIYGRTDREILQLTEESIWAGKERDTTTPDFRDKLDRIREMLLLDKASEAEEYAKQALSSAFHRVGSCESAGNLILDFGECENISDYRLRIYS